MVDGCLFSVQLEHPMFRLLSFFCSFLTSVVPIIMLHMSLVLIDLKKATVE